MRTVACTGYRWHWERGARQSGHDGWGMVAATPHAKWVSITSLRGARLHNPNGLLEGATLMRHVKLKTAEQFAGSRTDIERLLERAVHVNGPGGRSVP